MNLLYRSSKVHSRHSVLLEWSDNENQVSQSFYQPQTSPDDRGPTTAERMRRYELEAPKLALAAATRSLHDAQIDRERVTHLVTVSCSGFSAPGFDLALLEGLELNRGVARTHVGYMGCHGALNGLRVARAIALSEPNSVVLVCALELCSLHHGYESHRDQMVSNSLFADGAAAAVGWRQTDSQDTRPWRVSHQGSYVVPNTAELIGWRIGDHGFEMTLSQQVPNVIQASLRDWLCEWLASQQLTLAGVKSWAVHPGGPRIISSVEAALELPQSRLSVSREILAECGNLSSPTILFILQRLRAADAPRPCVAIGFGPGLTIEAALIR